MNAQLPSEGRGTLGCDSPSGAPPEEPAEATSHETAETIPPLASSPSLFCLPSASLISWGAHKSLSQGLLLGNPT